MIEASQRRRREVTVIEYPNDHPTNTVAERALRPAVLWRKGSFGSDSEAGCRFA